MWKLLQRLNKNLIIVIPAAMFSGFVFGLLTDASSLKSMIMPLTFLMVYPMMITLKVKEVLKGVDFKAQSLAQFINFAILPFVAYGLGLVFFPSQPYMALGFLLVGLLPTSGMTISWTGFANGNKETAVKMTVIGLALGALLTPFYVQFMVGATLDVNIWALSRQIVLIVLIPMIVGNLTQIALVKKYGPKEFQQIWAPKFPSLSTLGVVAIVFIAMALKAKSIYQDPQVLLYIVAPLALFYAFGYLISSVLGRYLLPPKEAIALVYGTVMRNLSVALAVAMNAFGEAGSSAALVIAAAFIIQVQSAAWTVKFGSRFFADRPENAVALEMESS